MKIKSIKDLDKKTLEKIKKGLEESNQGNVKYLESFKKYV